MTPDALEESIQEAERFLARAKSLAEKIYVHPRSGYRYVPSGADSGAVRRASMDLTRTLAKLRRREVP